MKVTSIKVILFMVFTWAFIIAGCDDDSTKKLPFGSACDGTVDCQGVCNTALPSGMCIEACSTEMPCAEGICTPFDETLSFCMPSCTENSECRDGYSCIGGICAPLSEIGNDCEEVEDCADCTTQTCPEGATVSCLEGICSVPCTTSEDCGDGAYCGLSEGTYMCVPIDFETGDGTFGYSCAQADCSEGFSCLGAGDEDATSYCTAECSTDRDCPPNFNCRDRGDGTLMCIKREVCEPCDLDYQCGFDTDKCVMSNPSTGSTENYCSVLCDPARTTCPLDFSCQEAFYCTGTGTWVADCAWCTSGTCETTGTTYQCFQDYGACTGGGELCTPCRIDDDCSEGRCLAFRDSQNKVCSRDCSSDGECPDGYACFDFGTVGEHCMPRTGSCTEPSGGKDMCQGCQDYTDCLRGDCISITGSTDDPTYCLDGCTDNTDCSEFAECVNISYYGYQFRVCRPTTTVSTCSNYLDCEEECPNGPDDCATGPGYCQ